MKYLLDVNVLLAALWENHPHHQIASTWLAGKSIVVCPLSELGCLRISSNPKAINVPMDKCREVFEIFLAETKAGRIPDDLPALASHPKKSDGVTDSYLASLAEKHGLKLATFDNEINHPAVTVLA